MLNINRRITIVIILILTLVLLILSYFFWPKTLNFNVNEVVISVDKATEGITSRYLLDDNEVHDLIKILEKSKLYNGVSRPDSKYTDKLIEIGVRGEGVFFILIYYDNNKTYVYANIFNNYKINNYYRISNKDDIRIFIENIMNDSEKKFIPLS